MNYILTLYFQNSTKYLMFTRSARIAFNQLSISVRIIPCAFHKKMSTLIASPYIGTHDGTFHCDDVTACFMLKTLDRFKNHEIVRTRNPEILSKADVVVDVGGELDVDKLRLDHHQRSFTKTILDFHPNLHITNPGKPVKLSSSGLVYAVFGKDITAKLLDLGGTYDKLKDEEKRMVDAVFDKAYIEFFEEIDAIDNGVEVASGDNVVYNYHISSGISSRVARLNPLNMDASPEDRLTLFKKAMCIVGSEMVAGIKLLGQIWWPQRQKFRELILNREKFDPSGQIISIGVDDLVGWRSSILELEKEFDIVGQIKYVVFCDGSEASPWRATCVPVSLKSFTCRAPLKEEWRGKREDELRKVSGISDAVFVHMNGFTGGAKSLEGIMSMVRKTLLLE